MNYSECDISRIVKVSRKLEDKEAPVQIEKISAQGLLRDKSGKRFLFLPQAVFNQKRKSRIPS